MKQKIWNVNSPLCGDRGNQPGPVEAFFRSFFSRFDWMQIVIMACLICVGLLFVYGTGQQVGHGTEIFWKRQLFYFFTGLAIWIALTCFDYRWIGFAGLIIYPTAILFLAGVFIFGVKVNEAYRWIRFAGITFQPSEIGKLAVIIVTSWILSFKKADVNRPLWALLILVMAGLPFFLIYKEPDLGSALVILPVTFAIAFAAKLKIRYIVIVLALVLCSAPVVYSQMRGYQKERIMTFLDPERDPNNRGWNAIQAELTVGSGGFSGKGYMNGTHCMLGYLPQTVANSDFIFPVISEEWGFLGSVFLIFLYAGLLFTIFRTALVASDDFGRYLCVGIGTLLAVHTTVNIGMCIRLLPITGVPLPFISYGGTFLVMMMTYLGIVQSVYAHRNRDSFVNF